ncbi:MAG: acetolactate synthase [Lachnospiraceae bacterium]|nr:acetolactate synthase [Lachnospiraceae bacterium]MBQ2116686.1 acetolactate synthase [Lachnospiraceae bacterium]MBQ2405067.1 acetolactate synthase [Lachnospiraceae bacterium]MEE0919622.1 acetolactate synthase [Lachnospiraceae bacterium]
MAVKQISVFIENHSGKLAEFCNLLSKNEINMRASSLADAQDFGIVRIIVDDIYKASTILKDAEYVFSIKDVIAIELPDHPGSLAKVLDILSQKDMNVEYMYAFTNHKAGSASMILRVNDVKTASELLSANGITQISQEELSEMK